MPQADTSFVLFGPAHIGAMLITAAVATGLCIMLRRAASKPFGPALQRATCQVLAVLLLSSWLAEDVVQLVNRTWSLQESLPLHLCDIALVLCALTLLELAGRPRPDAPRRQPRGVVQALYELAYFWGLGGTPQALLTPDIEQSFPSFLCVRFFFAHGGIIVAVLVMTIGLRMRPRRRAPLRAWLVTAGLALPVMLVNWLLGANYMFLCGPPGQVSLYDFLGPWPWTLLTLAGLAALVFSLCYLPFCFLGGRRGGVFRNGA